MALKPFRLTVLVLLAAFLPLPLTAHAAKRHAAKPTKQCAGGVSAVDQYCETLPGAGGAQGTPGGSAGTPGVGTSGVGTPGGGGPSATSGHAVATPGLLGSTLTGRPARAAKRSRAKQGLLSLPAAYPRTPVAGHPASDASTGSIARTLILVLALLTIALGALAAALRWRRRTAAT